MRKLATVQRIAEVRPIEGADAIEHYRVNGWWVVDKKDAYKIGDLVVYLELDSWLPHELAPFISKGKEPREYNGVKGERLRTIKLRGAVSQGLLLPLRPLFADWSDENFKKVFLDDETRVGDDLTESLNIQKWEPPIPAQLAGKMKGNFPSWARKTDQERCQNIWPEISEHIELGTRFEVTLKMDGSSASYGISPENEYMVCSRNLSLKTDQENNTFVDVGRKYEIEDKLKSYGKSIMISGELMGPGIQKNQEKLKDHQLFIFDIFDPSIGSYIPSKDRIEIVEKLGFQHVPILFRCVTLSELKIDSLDSLLKFAEGPSLNASHREGVVFKSVDGNFSFKAISNRWLLKNEG